MIAFSIFGLHIYRYGIFYFITFLLWYFFLKFLGEKKVFVEYPKVQYILEKKLEDLIIVLVLWILVWWRAWHFIIYYFQDFIANPLDFFKIWEWWMSFIWWMVWVSIWLLIFTRFNKFKLKDFVLLVDAVILVVPVGIVLWRVWNFLNQELYWLVVPSNFRWLSQFWISTFKSIHIFHNYTNIDNLIRLNTNFLAMFFEWLITLAFVSFAFYRSYKTKNIKPWLIIWVFLLNYSFVRFVLEYFRQDSSYEFIWSFSKSQYFFILFFILWLWLIAFSRSSTYSK